MSYLHLLKCDGCERTEPERDAKGWVTVLELVGHEDLQERIKEQEQSGGMTRAISGEFCSLRCLASWAENGHKLRELEAGDG